MSTTPNLGITLLELAQSQKETSVNAGFLLLDAAIGRYRWTTVDYTVLRSDRVVPVNATTTKTVTMPATTGSLAPYVGQPFKVIDASGALTTNFASIVIAVPSGKKLNGVTDGTATIYSDYGYAEVVFLSDALGYQIVDSKGILDTVDQFVNISSLMLGPNYAANNAITLPTAANHVPGYIPFVPHLDIGVDQVVFPFGSAGPSSDVSNASIRYGFYSSHATTRMPTTLLWAVEDALLQGTGHLRSTADVTIANIGSLCTSIAPKTLSARRVFRKGRLYWLAYHLQPTFSAGTATEINRSPFGLQVLKLSAGAQAWPYTMAASPTVGAQFGADTLSRLDLGLRFRMLS